MTVYKMSIKSITVDPEIPEGYVPHDIKDADTARAASIHLLFSHVADFHKLIVKIIAEKYKIKEEEIYESIVEHPEYKDMIVNPVIYGLSYVHQEDIRKTEVKNEVIEPPPQRIKVIRKKKAVVEKIEKV